MDALLLTIVMLIGLACGIPVVYAFLLASAVTILFADTGITYTFVAQSLTVAGDSFPLMAIPFFILAGLIMGRGGISRRLFVLANALVGHLPGGIGVAAVLTAMFFSAISGSGLATVAAVGSIMIPEMVKSGYTRKYSAALIAAAGTIGVVLPPSIPLVLFGVVTGTSIGDLFIAAVIPGILMGLVLMGWVIVHAKRHHIRGVERSTWRERAQALWGSIGGLLMPVIILGGIYGGVFTPTEAAVIAVVYGLVVSLGFYRETTLREILNTFGSAAISTSALMVMVTAAVVFGHFLTIEDVPATIVSAMSGISDNPVVIVLLANLLLLLIGTFMDTIPAILLTSPVLMPVLAEAGLDPIHIGIIVVVQISIGFVTPPLGPNVFIASNTAKVSSEQTMVAIMPGIALLLGVALLVSFVPWLSMALIAP
ncbi:TRAP transporter large permease [Citricoccus muralis]|uniref:TRAP transporter large permease n=1 Tax=Citricoccus muralis TaxID=169134 RepID=A0ABY8H8S8_9MICC|nr:TRAP transporter large permease [Citricoccus muralis]WFP17234.1 TRAP transporter large permease [Citricoccus muralis]